MKNAEILKKQAQLLAEIDFLVNKPTPRNIKIKSNQL